MKRNFIAESDRKDNNTYQFKRTKPRHRSNNNHNITRSKSPEPKEPQAEKPQEITYKCKSCTKEVEDECIECSTCQEWLHRTCTTLRVNEFKFLVEGNEAILWVCSDCLNKKGVENKRITALETKLIQLETQTGVKIDKMNDNIEKLQVHNLEILTQ